MSLYTVQITFQYVEDMTLKIQVIILSVYG